MNFFVMNAFLIPPKHFFPIARLLLWFAFGNIGFREGHEDVVTWNTVDRKHNPVEGRLRSSPHLQVPIWYWQSVLSLYTCLHLGSMGRGHLRMLHFLDLPSLLQGRPHQEVP